MAFMPNALKLKDMLTHTVLDHEFQLVRLASFNNGQATGCSWIVQPGPHRKCIHRCSMDHRDMSILHASVHHQIMGRGRYMDGTLLGMY